MRDVTAVPMTSEAIEQWRTRIRLDTEVNYLYCMGLALERTGELKYAEDLFRRALERDRTFAGARAEWIRLLRQRGDLVQAEQLEKEGLSLDGDFPLAARLDQLRDLAAPSTELQSLLPSIHQVINAAVAPDVRRRGQEALRDVLTALAYQAMQQNDDETAAMQLEEAIALAIEPLSPLLTQLAQVRRRQGHHVAAAEAIHQAWTRLRADGNSQDLQTIGMLALIMLRNTLRLDEALVICDALLRESPDNSNLIVHKGLLLVANHRIPEAVSMLHAACSRAPTNPLLQTYFSISLAARGDADAALAAATRAVELDRSKAAGLQALGTALALTGRPSQGLETIIHGNSLEPATDWGKTTEAVARWLGNDPDGARRAVAESLTIPFPMGHGHNVGFLLRLRPYAEEYLTAVYSDLGVILPA